MTAILTIAFLWNGLVTRPQVTDSGRCVTLAETPDARVSPQRAIAPGPPPLLSFRYYEGKAHHRFGNTDLMLDDAGH